jgi:hypothetical protein
VCVVDDPAGEGRHRPIVIVSSSLYIVQRLLGVHEPLYAAGKVFGPATKLSHDFATGTSDQAFPGKLRPRQTYLVCLLCRSTAFRRKFACR